MNTQKLLAPKNKITLISGLLILSAFLSKWLLSADSYFQVALMIAGIIGVLPIAIQAFQALKVKVISIDLLVTLAVTGAFVIKNYEEAAIVSFLFLFGSYLEQRTIQKTRSAIQDLVEMMPETALRYVDEGEYEEVDLWDVDPGNILLVRTGDYLPVDGKVLEGEAYVNESSLTGEPALISKHSGSPVFAGTLLEDGSLHIQAEQVGEDTTFGKIIELIEDAQDSKSDTERFIDRFAKYYTPIVLVLSIVLYLFTRDLELAITALVLGCPGALVIGVPVSYVAGIGNGARHGVLLKGSEVIHDLANTSLMAFDKTGTLTVGEPEVDQIKLYGKDQEKIINYLVSVEAQTNHPLAYAITRHFSDVTPQKVENLENIRGKGIKAFINHEEILVGNETLMKEHHVVFSDQMQVDYQDLSVSGHSVVMLAINKELQLILGIKDQLRPNLKSHLDELKQQGVKEFAILSGDQPAAVKELQKELNISQSYGGILPQEKAEIIKEFQTNGETVCFVGDGINDSPSLALADVGIAMGSGTDVAIETSDVVLMHSDFDHLNHAVGLAKAIRSNMRQNIIIALGTVLFLLWSLFFTDWLTMSIGMLVHEGSILVVILNGIRLLRYKRRSVKNKL